MIPPGQPVTPEKIADAAKALSAQEGVGDIFRPAAQSMSMLQENPIINAALGSPAPDLSRVADLLAADVQKLDEVTVGPKR
jgi:hypothetical protein